MSGEQDEESDRRSATVAWLSRWWAPLVFLVAAAAVTIHIPYDNAPPIRSDGLGYHAWTRVLLDGNVSFCDYEGLPEVGAVSPRADTWRCANKYAPGLALLRFPVMGWFTAANGGELRSSAEDTVSLWGGVLAGAAAVALSVALARRLGATSLAANLGAAALAVGGGLFHYATYDGSFTHVYSAAFVALLLLCGHAYRVASPRGRRCPTFGVAGAAGWLVLLRVPSTLVVGGIAGVWALTELRRLGGPIQVWQEHRRLLLWGGGAVAGAMTIHIGYASYIFGELRLSAYSDERFFVDGFHGLEVLGSVRRGLVVWYPVVAVALLASIAGRCRTLVALIAATVLPLTALYGAWHSWDLAGGFGHRGFVELAPLFAVALAVGASRSARWARATTVVLATVATTATFGLMRAYWAGDLYFYGATGDEWTTYAIGRESIVATALAWLFG